MTWTIKTRGDCAGPILSEYRCPEHGVFEAVVPRDEHDDPPDRMPCPFSCPHDAAWTPSSPRIKHPAFLSAHRGKNDDKPHPFVLDTEPLADGRETYAEFQKRRAAMWAAHDADNDPDRPRKVFSR